MMIITNSDKPISGHDSGILTMAFVNMQPIADEYDIETGYKDGTIFPELNKPLLVGGMMR